MDTQKAYKKQIVPLVIVAAVLVITGAVMYMGTNTDSDETDMDESSVLTPQEEATSYYEQKVSNADTEQQEATALLGLGRQKANEGAYQEAITLLQQAIDTGQLDELTTTNTIIKITEYHAELAEFEVAIQKLNDLKANGYLPSNPYYSLEDQINERIASYQQGVQYQSSGRPDEE